MNLIDATLRVAGLMFMTWLIIKVIVWFAERVGNRAPRRIRRWTAKDAEWLSDHRIDLTSTADEQRDGGAR